MTSALDAFLKLSPDIISGGLCDGAPAEHYAQT